jgi:hypothetical protein
MTNRNFDKVKNRMNKLVSKSLYAIVLCAVSTQVAFAQGYTTLRNPLLPGVPHEAADVAPLLGPPPPIGDGTEPPLEIKGDTEQAPHVPTGHADPTTGSRFATVPGDTYKAPILVRGARHGDTLMQYTEKYPYPNVKHVTIDGKRYQYIDTDSPAAGFPKEANRFKYGGLPHVQILARYLVILGVVAATVMMAFAAYSVVLGEDGAGARVIHIAGGLMLLFMAFTIWKIAQANMRGLDDNGRWDVSNHMPADKILLPDPRPRQAVPEPPAVPPPLRSGVPVYPDSAN